VVNRVGARQVFEANKQVYSSLGRLGKLNVKVRQAFDDAEGMQRIFDKAKARNEARRTVDEAIDRLNQRLKDKGGLKTGNLDSFRLIMDEVQRAGPQGNLGDHDFFAVHHKAWKKSVEAGREKPIFLLKRRGGDRGRDGTSALKSDLDKMARAGDWVRYATAVNLTALLDDFKNLQPFGEKRMKLLGENSEDLKDLALCLPVDFYNSIKSAQSPSDVAQAFIVAYQRHRQIDENSSDTFYDFLGKTATKFIHPRLETVLEAARQCPTKNNNQFSLDHEYILKLFQHHFDLFSGPEVWSHRAVKASLYEYYGVALSIAALEKLSQKASFSQDDVALLKGTLKHVTPAEHKDPKIREQLAEKIAARQKKISDAFARIDLEGDPGNVLFEMSKVVADHYMKVLNFDDYSKRPAVVRAIETAHDVNDVIPALKNAFSQAIQRKVDRETFFQPLEDLAAGSP
jgi:hypothetical protein